MNWHDLEQCGWSWATGYSQTRAEHYAQAWRDRPRPIRIDGKWNYREVISEGGKSVAEAERKLWERLEQLEA